MTRAKANVGKASAVKLKREIRKVNAEKASVVRVIKAIKKGSVVKGSAVAKAKLSSLYDHV